MWRNIWRDFALFVSPKMFPFVWSLLRECYLIFNDVIPAWFSTQNNSCSGITGTCMFLFSLFAAAIPLNVLVCYPTHSSHTGGDLFYYLQLVSAATSYTQRCSATCSRLSAKNTMHSLLWFNYSTIYFRLTAAMR